MDGVFVDGDVSRLRFPSGFKALGDYLHARNISFGFYSAESTGTCGGYPASKGYEEIDAKSFASWGVDYLKVSATIIERHRTIMQSIMQTVRTVQFRWAGHSLNLSLPLSSSVSVSACLSLCLVSCVLVLVPVSRCVCVCVRVRVCVCATCVLFQV